MLVNEIENRNKEEIEIRFRAIQLELRAIFSGHNPNNLNPISLVNELYYIIKKL